MMSARRSSLTASRGAVHAWQVLEQEAEAGRSGRGIGDDGLDAAVAQQVGQAGLAAEPVAVGIDVGGQADPLPGHERRGQRPRSGGPIGGEGERHAGNIIRASGRAGGRASGRAGGERRAGGRADGRAGGRRTVER